MDMELIRPANCRAYFLPYSEFESHRKKKGRMDCNLVVTTYGLVRSATDDFISHSKTIWNYVALDEGHQIKNSSAEVSKACRAICSPDTRRLLLTGTPILNRLKELWSLFDFATNGKVLGSSKEFTRYYANHIEGARDRLATQGEIELGQRKNEELQGLIHPYFLQRLKIDFLKDKLPQKHDVVVWTHLSSEQRQRYTEFVESGDGIVRSILTGDVTSPLEAVTWLKKLCGHPLLTEATGQQMASVLRHKDPKKILKQSAKLQVLVALVKDLKQKGHRPLIFSQSTKMLDTINFVLRNEVVLARIDGSTPERDRQHYVDAFNRENSRYDAMLLSTKAAGCGLTLIGADTNIIYDPSWYVCLLSFGDFVAKMCLSNNSQTPAGRPRKTPKLSIGATELVKQKKSRYIASLQQGQWKKKRTRNKSTRMASDALFCQTTKSWNAISSGMSCVLFSSSASRVSAV